MHPCSKSIKGIFNHFGYQNSKVRKIQMLHGKQFIGALFLQILRSKLRTFDSFLSVILILAITVLSMLLIEVYSIDTGLYRKTL